MGLALVLANVGRMPFEHPPMHLSISAEYPLAVHMLLFDSDIKKVARNTGQFVPLLRGGVRWNHTWYDALLVLLNTMQRKGWRCPCCPLHSGGCTQFNGCFGNATLSPLHWVSSEIAADGCRRGAMLSVVCFG